MRKGGKDDVCFNPPLKASWSKRASPGVDEAPTCSENRQPQDPWPSLDLSSALLLYPTPTSPDCSDYDNAFIGHSLQSAAVKADSISNSAAFTCLPRLIWEASCVVLSTFCDLQLGTAQHLLSMPEPPPERPTEPRWGSQSHVPYNPRSPWPPGCYRTDSAMGVEKRIQQLFLIKKSFHSLVMTA